MELIDIRFIDIIPFRNIDWISYEFGIHGLDSVEQRRAYLRDRMNQSIEDYKKIKGLQLLSESYLLADSELEWINSIDDRFLSWLKHNYTIPADTVRPEAPQNLSDKLCYKAFIFGLDVWKANLNTKSSFLNDYKSRWHQQQQRDKKLAWIDKKNVDQIAWAWNYLLEHLKIPNSINTLNPTNHDETYLSIFSKFYAWPGNSAKLREIQGKMKQAWAQQKYRANLKGKKQSTFVLSVEAKLKLRKLATARNVNLNQMLEYIIIKEPIRPLNEEV